MKKENYKEIAYKISLVYPPTSEAEQIKKNIVLGLADCFEKENPPFIQYFKKYGFDKKQFLKDCGIGQ